MASRIYVVRRGAVRSRGISDWQRTRTGGLCLRNALLGIRLSLQPFLSARYFLTTWWLRTGYHLLTILFASFTLILGWGTIH